MQHWRLYLDMLRRLGLDEREDAPPVGEADTARSLVLADGFALHFTLHDPVHVCAVHARLGHADRPDLVDALLAANWAGLPRQVAFSLEMATGHALATRRLSLRHADADALATSARGFARQARAWTGALAGLREHPAGGGTAAPAFDALA